MTVGEMLERMSAAEMSEWQAYYTINPFGDVRDDLRAGIVASTIANANRGKGQKPFAPADFMPDFTPPQQKAARDLKRALKMRS